MKYAKEAWTLYENGPQVLERVLEIAHQRGVRVETQLTRR